MKDSKPVHQFPSFAQYLKKVFHLPAYVNRLTDARLDPDISPQVVFRALLYGFVFRTPSLKQLDQVRERQEAGGLTRNGL